MVGIVIAYTVTFFTRCNNNLLHLVKVHPPLLKVHIVYVSNGVNYSVVAFQNGRKRTVPNFLYIGNNNDG